MERLRSKSHAVALNTVRSCILSTVRQSPCGQSMADEACIGMTQDSNAVAYEQASSPIESSRVRAGVPNFASWIVVT